MASGTDGHGGSGQQALDRFAQMMIERMEKMKKSDWQQGWIGGAASVGLPQNVMGRNYSGSNSFFLQLYSASQGYKLPVFMTFRQAHNFKAHVLKGEKAFPVIYWDMLVRDKDGKKISSDEYRAMSRDERKNLDVIPFVKAFPVYNLDQTNFREVQPERMQKLLDRFKVPELRDTQGMYAHSALDSMVAQQSWLCHIQADREEIEAYYSPSRDIVVLPMKAQFNRGMTPEDVYRDGMEFYSTMLHEMAHSTMTPERLNRDGGARFGDPKYAKEELVAELTAAMISHSMGFDSKVTDNSAAYLDSWITKLKQEPKFIVSVMADVNKASEMILDRVDAQRISLGEQPYLAKNDPWVPAPEDEICPFKNASIVKTRSGDFAIRASYNGVDLGMKPIERSTARIYFQLTDRREKDIFLGSTIRKHYESEIAGIDRKASKSLSMA
jgi:antirestriction protein ArdC